MLIFEKIKHYYKNIDQCTGQKCEVLGKWEKLETFSYLYQYLKYLWCELQRLKCAALSLLISDLQWYLCKLNKASMNMLKAVKTYIAWWYPNLKSVSKSIRKYVYDKNLQQMNCLKKGSDLYNLFIWKCFKEVSNYLVL